MSSGVRYFLLCLMLGTCIADSFLAPGRLPLVLWPRAQNGFYEIPVEPPPPNEFPSGAWETIIAWAMRHIEQGSNIRFRPAASSDVNRLKFVSGEGCFSVVGRHPKAEPQRVSLENPHCLHRHAALHELLHAIGLPHEHQRPDALQHVRVTANAPEWFRPHASPDGDVAPALAAAMRPYDTASVMHYNQWLAAVNPALQAIVDARPSTLSSCDWHLLNSLYPGPMPAIDCNPHAHPRACQPLPQCPYGWMVCDYICNLDCDMGRAPPDGSQALCDYVGHGEFPPLPFALQLARNHLNDESKVGDI